MVKWIVVMKIQPSISLDDWGKLQKSPVRLIGTGIRTGDLPNASLVCYHGTTSLGCHSFVLKFDKLNIFFDICLSPQLVFDTEVWWSPYIDGLWFARLPADHACCTTPVEVKRIEMNEMSVEKSWNESCGRGRRDKPRGKSSHTRFRPPRNPHGVIETQTRGPSGGKRASNPVVCNPRHACH